MEHLTNEELIKINAERLQAEIKRTEAYLKILLNISRKNAIKIKSYERR